MLKIYVKSTKQRTTSRFYSKISSLTGMTAGKNIVGPMDLTSSMKADRGWYKTNLDILDQ